VPVTGARSLWAKAANAPAELSSNQNQCDPEILLAFMPHPVSLPRSSESQQKFSDWRAECSSRMTLIRKCYRLHCRFTGAEITPAI